ncbi:MAG: DUF3127 domain-containing protein [Owenweeksia sp.]|nr:DUF3127 domain-containing protein [Owenweeksia sp.]
MEVEGIIKKIEDTQQIKETFKKRNLVVTTEEQYPQHLLVEFVQDKTSLLDQFNEGDKVTIGINLRGREWQSPQGEVKYFNSINGWRIEKKEPAMSNNAASSGPADMPPMPPMQDESEDEDDLPF